MRKTSRFLFHIKTWLSCVVNPLNPVIPICQETKFKPRLWSWSILPWFHQNRINWSLSMVFRLETPTAAVDDFIFREKYTWQHLATSSRVWCRGAFTPIPQLEIPKLETLMPIKNIRECLWSLYHLTLFLNQIALLKGNVPCFALSLLEYHIEAVENLVHLHIRVGASFKLYCLQVSRYSGLSQSLHGSSLHRIQVSSYSYSHAACTQ